MTTRCATHLVHASFEPGSSARCATNAKTTRSAGSPNTEATGEWFDASIEEVSERVA